MLVLVLALAGCDQLLGVEQTVAMHVDAAPIDGPSCTTALDVHDTFDSSPACAPWGFLDNTSNSMTTSGGGRLVIQPAPNAINTRGGCIENGTMAFDTASGVFVKVASRPATNEYQELLLEWDNGHELGLLWGGNIEYVQDHSLVVSVRFDPVTTAWVRVRPTPDHTAILCEYSADAAQWTVLGIDPVAAPARVRVSLHGGVCGGGIGCPGTNPSAPIYFERLNTCP